MQQPDMKSRMGQLLKRTAHTLSSIRKVILTGLTGHERSALDAKREQVSLSPPSMIGRSTKNFV